ncbi:hypothetical protein R1sor_012279 [Riccia sorocarpa]|uniref:Uncharacterized protein n=1 Tax=Riccia sorocarpa TaxID=122646 RepID=A0ABD3I3B1_9MARC
MIKAANNTHGGLLGACPGVKLKIGNVEMEQNIFVQDGASYPVISGMPFIKSVRMETKIHDDGSAYARIRSNDGKQVVQFLTVLANHERNMDALRRKPLPRFIDLREDGCAVYKRVEDLERWERKEIIKIQKELRYLGELENDECISGVYEECGLEDPLGEIMAIGMGDEDVVVQIQSRELYSMIEKFEKVEVMVETKYKSVDKKVKPVAIPLPEDAKIKLSKRPRRRA